MKVGLHLGWQIAGCNTQDNRKSCRAAALGQTSSLLLESLDSLVLLSMLSPNGFESSGKTAFYTVQGVLHVKSLANVRSLSCISCAEMVNAWNNENFWHVQLAA